MTDTKPRRHKSDWERELNAEIRTLRKTHNDINARLRYLYNYIHSPRTPTGDSLAVFLHARAHIPPSQYPDEFTMAKNAISEILELQSKIPTLQKDYDRLLSHRGTLKARLEDEKRTHELEGQMVDCSNCVYEEHNHFLESNEVEEASLYEAFIAGDYSVNTESGATRGPFEDPLPASAEHYEEPIVGMSAQAWHMAMMKRTELGVEWTPKRVQGENAGEQAFINDEFTHENTGNSMDFDTIQQRFEAFSDEEVEMAELVNV